MSRLFRKYHRWLAIVGTLPLLVIVITGITFLLAKMFYQRHSSSYVAPTNEERMFFPQSKICNVSKTKFWTKQSFVLATRSSRVVVNSSAYDGNITVRRMVLYY